MATKVRYTFLHQCNRKTMWPSVEDRVRSLDIELPQKWSEVRRVLERKYEVTKNVKGTSAYFQGFYVTKRGDEGIHDVYAQRVLVPLMKYDMVKEDMKLVLRRRFDPLGRAFVPFEQEFKFVNVRSSHVHVCDNHVHVSELEISKP